MDGWRFHFVRPYCIHGRYAPHARQLINQIQEAERRRHSMHTNTVNTIDHRHRVPFFVYVDAARLPEQHFHPFFENVPDEINVPVQQAEPEVEPERTTEREVLDILSREVIGTVEYNKVKNALHFFMLILERSSLIIQPPKDALTNKDNCTICLVPYDPDCWLRMLQCSHSFHTPCIDYWLKIHYTCPLCRRGILGNKFHINELPENGSSDETALAQSNESNEDEGEASGPLPESPDSPEEASGGLAQASYSNYQPLIYSQRSSSAEASNELPAGSTSQALVSFPGDVFENIFELERSRRRVIPVLSYRALRQEATRICEGIFQQQPSTSYETPIVEEPSTSFEEVLRQLPSTSHDLAHGQQPSTSSEGASKREGSPLCQQGVVKRKGPLSSCTGAVSRVRARLQDEPTPSNEEGASAPAFEGAVGRQPSTSYEGLPQGSGPSSSFAGVIKQRAMLSHKELPPLPPLLPLTRVTNDANIIEVATSSEDEDNAVAPPPRTWENVINNLKDIGFGLLTGGSKDELLSELQIIKAEFESHSRSWNNLEDRERFLQAEIISILLNQHFLKLDHQGKKTHNTGSTPVSGTSQNQQQQVPVETTTVLKNAEENVDCIVISDDED